MASIDDIGKKKRGRPPTDATPVLVRLMPTQVTPLDAWIAAQPDPKPSRPEAIRYALTDWLIGQGYLNGAVISKEEGDDRRK